MPLDRIHHILEERYVTDELLCRYASDISHQPILADKSVRGRNDIVLSRIEQAVGYLKVDKARMVHKYKARLAPSKLLHTYLFEFEFGSNEIGQGNDSDKRPQQKARAIWLSDLLFRFIQDLAVAYSAFNLHKNLQSNVVELTMLTQYEFI